ncbi:MAG: ABC transporter ATP-binding protein [Pedosphaera sp.]|nr:ABC transporter ATP-binding protein [Pedosphaera sp.]
MKNIFRALTFFRPDASRISGVFALTLVTVGLNLLKPWPLALIVDSVLGTKPLPDWFGSLAREGTDQAALILLLAGAIFVLHAGQGVISAAQNFLAISVGLRGLRRVRNKVFACLQGLSLRFHHGSKSGDLIYRAAWDTYSFQNLFQQGLVTFVTALCSLVLMVVVMLRLNVPLTLVAVATIPLLLAVIRFFGRKMTERGAAAQQADSAVTTLVQQNIAALPLVQSYTRESLEEKQFNTQTAVAQDQRLTQHGWELLYWLAITGVFGLGTAAIVWLGASEVLAGRLTIGTLWIFLSYLAQLYEPLNQLSHVGATVASASAGTGRVLELLDTKEEVKDAPEARSVVRGTWNVESDHAPRPTPYDPLLTRGEITFENVSFSYQPDQPVLHELSFTLRPGESCAIIGPSGAGKSTLMNLLPRFYDPVRGAVKLDGADLRGLKLHDLRSQIAVVLQEPILLPMTLAENIAYGKPGASLAEIEAAARAANAHGFIEKLPDKYRTVVGEGAARLSVGERQRINIARAFLKDAPILLLDEPTSALDAESEAQVVASLFDLMKGRTTLMVAHRLTTIRRVDKILVLEAGRLTGCGRPAELAQQPGYYARVTGGQAALD